MQDEKPNRKPEEDTAEEIENLAEIQFGRGQLAGHNDLAAKVEKHIEEMGREARAMQDPA